MTGQVNFTSHLDGVVHLAVGLVNLVTPGLARGTPYDPPPRAALRVELADLLGDRDSAAAVSIVSLATLGTAAGPLRTVFEAAEANDHDRAATTLNKLMTGSGARPHLARHDGEHWHLHFHERRAPFAAAWVASLATGLAVVLGSEHADRLGVCSAVACDRVFVDTSRNGTRRFCSTSCQSRVKAAAFRARQRRTTQ